MPNRATISNHNTNMELTTLLALFTTTGIIESAQAACQDSADGFASLNGGTTGGNGGTVVTVSSFDDLAEYAASEGKYVIQVQGRIDVTPFGYEIPVGSDKTIVGLGSDGEIYQGGFSLQVSSRSRLFRFLACLERCVSLRNAILVCLDTLDTAASSRNVLRMALY